MIWSSSPIVQYFLQTTKDIATYQQWDDTKSYEQCPMCSLWVWHFSCTRTKHKIPSKKKRGSNSVQRSFFSFILACLVLIFSILICGSKRKGQDKQWLTNITNHSWELTALVVTIISGRGVNEMTPINATYEGSPRDISWAESWSVIFADYKKSWATELIEH